MSNQIAQTSHNLGNVSGLYPIGQGGPNAINMLAQVLSTTIGLLTVIGVLYFIFILISGAIALINAGGDKGAVEAARRKLTTGVIGVVILVITIFVMDFITTLLGIPNILNLSAMLSLISIQ